MKSINLNVGGLYSCEEYFLLLFPDKESVVAARASTMMGSGADSVPLSVAADFWSRRFGKSVNYVEKNIPLLVLDMEQDCVHVLAGDQAGWIVSKVWLNLKEIG